MLIQKSVIATVVLLVAGGVQVAGQHGHGEGHHVDGPRHDFSDAERWASLFDAEDRDQWQKPKQVVGLMQIETGMTVADLGAGTGYFLEWIAASVGDQGRVLALDPEEALVDHMRQRAADQGWHRVEARQIPFDDPGLGDDLVDRILIVDTWHHIEDREDYAAKLRTSLRDEGRIYIVDFTPESPLGPPAEHRVGKEQVKTELEAGGLEVKVLDEDLPYQFVLEAFASKDGNSD